MLKRIMRTEDLEVTLLIKKEEFIRPPRDAQRHAVVNQAMKEFATDLQDLHVQAGTFVAGDTMIDFGDRTHSVLPDNEIMEDWQIPIMKEMAAIVGEGHGDVLEIGFGLGVASSLIQQQNVRSHTIIECNESVVARYTEWKKAYPGQDIRMVEGLWQDRIGELGHYDGIFFHTYPLNEEEYMNYVHGKVTFAGHFFEHAAAHLNPGGVFTYLTNEIDSLSRAHQRLLFKYFSSFSLQLVQLELPANIRDTWWAKSMVVIKAVK